MSRWLVVILLVFIVFVIGGILLTRAYLFATPQQPIAFSHRTHIERGVQCLYCHSNALRSQIAGIPSVEKCMGCHNVIATENPDVQKVADFWNLGEPIPWVQVNHQADFVYFSHQPHLAAGVSCEFCHGDVGQMDVARPVVNMDMGWCLDCHLAQPEEQILRLTDCLACHK